MNTISLNIRLENKTLTVSTDGLSISINPSLLKNNVEMIKSIILSTMKNLGLDADQEQLEELGLSASTFLTTLESYTEESEFVIVISFQEDGKFSQTFNGTISINIFNLFNKMSQMFES